MENFSSKRPEQGEYAQYYGSYVSLVGGSDILTALGSQIAATKKTLGEISEEKSRFRYAEGKWSIREVVGHLIDTEIIMAYRALNFARNAAREIEGFSQDDFVANSGHDSCKIADLSKHFQRVRLANIDLFKSFSADAWARAGIASGNRVSVRALAFIIAGHEIHHLKILRERYLASQ